MGLSVIRGGSEERLGDSRLHFSCRSAIRDEALCIAGDGEWSHLWRVRLDETGGAGIRLMGSIRQGFVTVADISPRTILLCSHSSTLVVMDRESGAMRQVELGDGGFIAAVALAGPSRIAALHDEGEGTVLRIYELNGR
jgi:hypothetical protein